MFIVKYVYKRLKIDSAAINVSPGEFSYCDELYSEMKEELLKIL